MQTINCNASGYFCQQQDRSLRALHSSRDTTSRKYSILRLTLYILLGLSTSGCFPSKYYDRAIPSATGAVAPSSGALCEKCDRNIPDLSKERKTSGMGYALYYDAQDNMLYGEDLMNAQCRIVPVSILPEIQSPCPADKPYLCGTSPKFCSTVKYPGCT